MRVLHVVSGSLGDGATRGALWLHHGLRSCGVDSRVLLTEGSTTDPSIVPLASGTFDKLMVGVKNKLDNLPKIFYPHRKPLHVFSVGRFGLDITQHPTYAWADLINFHWVTNGMVALGKLPAIDKPLVWTLRDMWPLTGGCHYAMGCERYKSGCGACPQLGSCSDNDLSAAWCVRWRQRFVPKQTVVVGISRWISDCARNSAALRGMDIRVIMNSVDTDLFFPVPKAEARARLGLPADARIILSGSIHPSSYYKGYDMWQAAVAELRQDDVYFALIGNYIPHPGDPSRLRAFGLVRDDTVLRDIYAAADVFILPSRQEAFGKTGVEAMACGTPVVAFDATGPRDIIAHRTTGYLAKPFVVDDLVAGVRWILADPERGRQLSVTAAEIARRRFGTAVAAAQYRDLYREILETASCNKAATVLAEAPA